MTSETLFKKLSHLDTSLLHITETETFVVEARLVLPIRFRGVRLTPLKGLARAAYCAAQLQAIPRFSERKIKHTVYNVAIPELEEFVGTDMGDSNTRRR
ncbi:hypothetical protein TrCOL_g8411, partial [Triparma columacea]